MHTNVPTIARKMIESVRRMANSNQPAIEPKARGFADTLALARGKHVLIALRGHPDPDGIASAIAQAHIAQRLASHKRPSGTVTSSAIERIERW